MVEVAEGQGRPSVRVHAIAVVGPAMGDLHMPSKGEIRDQQDAVAREEAMLDTLLGKVVRHEIGLYQAEYGGASVLWIPREDRVLQARLMVCAHIRDAGHRGVKATIHRLGACCVWDDMEKNVGKFVRQCLHCARSSLVIGVKIKNVFEISKYQGAYEMADVVDVGKDPERPG